MPTSIVPFLLSSFLAFWFFFPHGIIPYLLSLLLPQRSRPRDFVLSPLMGLGLRAESQSLQIIES